MTGVHVHVHGRALFGYTPSPSWPAYLVELRLGREEHTRGKGLHPGSVDDSGDRLHLQRHLEKLHLTHVQKVDVRKQFRVDCAPDVIWRLVSTALG